MMHCNVIGGRLEIASIVEEMTFHYMCMMITCFDLSLTGCLKQIVVADVGIGFC